MARITSGAVGGHDTTSLDQRYYDLAQMALQVAESNDSPSIMYVMSLLTLHRYSSVRKGKMVAMGAWLAQAVRAAQAMGMSKEWEALPMGESELRRRLMWALYVADR